MKNLRGTRTEERLLEAFKEEATAMVKYQLFAGESEYKVVKSFFKHVARHEKEHAEVFLELLNGIGNDLENLQNSIALEGFVSAIDYVESAIIAEEEGFSEIAEKFRKIAKIEQRHKKTFENYFQLIRNGAILKRNYRQMWMCMKCGFIHEGYCPPEKCPVCEHDKDNFKIYEEGE